MDIGYALTLFEALRGDRFAFGYSGGFHDDHTARLIALGESVLEDAPGNLRSRLAFVLVEAYQNIIRHRAELPPGLADGAGRSLFTLRCQAAGQQVVAMNPVANTTVPRLQEVLRRLEGLDKGQLKELFLARLQEGDSGSTRGAGLGLIEMTRRSGERLGHALHQLGPDHGLFALAIRLGEGPDHAKILEDAMAMHAAVVREDVRVYHVGPRTAAIEEAVLRLIERDEDEDHGTASVCGRGYLAALETMAHYAGPRANGVVMLCGSAGRRGITLGMPVPTDIAERFQRELTEALAWDRLHLERHYRDHLLGRSTGPVPIGLIDLLRLSVEAPQWSVAPLDSDAFVAVRMLL